MTKPIKPMLATKADLEKIKYPVLATPKLDGIRCIMVDGEAMSRSMKPIQNEYVREVLEMLPDLDGELMVKGDFNQVSSAIMKRTGEPDFTYCVFDIRSDKPYTERMSHLREIYRYLPEQIELILPTIINNEEELLALLDKYLEEGYEGVMIRQPDSPYKYGRSTVKEGYLLKIKRFFDDEAKIVRFVEKKTNMNVLEKDELGYAKRSSCKDQLVPAGTLGSMVLSWHGKEFSVGFGPGITDAIKQEWWDTRDDIELDDPLVTFRYQELSKDGIPRFGKMIGFRHEDDL